MGTPRPDVHVHGDGLVGRAITRELRAAGVEVLHHRTPGAVAWRDDLPACVFPCHLEPPHRHLAALGEHRGREIRAFVESTARPPGMRVTGTQPSGVRATGWDWALSALEAEAADADMAACATLGLLCARTATGLLFASGGLVDLGADEAHTVDQAPTAEEAAEDAADPDASPAEDNAVHVLTQPPSAGALGAAHIAEWVMPVRWHAVSWHAGSWHTASGLAGPGHPAHGQDDAAIPRLARPRLSRQASVFAIPGPLNEPASLTLFGARWADPHAGVGDTHTAPSASVVGALSRLARQDHHLVRPPDRVVTFVTAESCDGLPIVGTLPGQPRVHVCTGFGALGPTYGVAAAAYIVASLLDRETPPLPPTFAARRLQ